MKRVLVFGLTLVLFTACGKNQPAYTDNGNPGQIKAIVFYDDNKNGKMDAGEDGVQAQGLVRISQEMSCPPTANNYPYMNTDASGVHEFNDLKPGKYCLDLLTGVISTTKLAQEIYVSSEQVTTVFWGIGR